MRHSKQFRSQAPSLFLHWPLIAPRLPNWFELSYLPCSTACVSQTPHDGGILRLIQCICLDVIEGSKCHDSNTIIDPDCRFPSHSQYFLLEELHVGAHDGVLAFMSSRAMSRRVSFSVPLHHIMISSEHPSNSILGQYHDASHPSFLISITVSLVHIRSRLVLN